MKSLVVFGDSFAEGNSFAEELSSSFKVVNHAVSGTTVGDYSLYPVGDNSLQKLLEKNLSTVKNADIILLTYSWNDASAMAVEYTTINRVVIDLVKAFDFITQNNPLADIVFLLPTNALDDMSNRAMTHAKYILEQYTRGAMDNVMRDVNVVALRWQRYYRLFADAVVRLFGKRNVAYMFDDISQLEKHLSDDGIHPDKIGHHIIAENVKKYFNGGRYSVDTRLQ